MGILYLHFALKKLKNAALPHEHFLTSNLIWQYVTESMCKTHYQKLYTKFYIQAGGFQKNQRLPHHLTKLTLLGCLA